MKIVVTCYPTEVIHKNVWRAIRNAWVSLAKAWGVDLDIEETTSLEDAEMRCPD